MKLRVCSLLLPALSLASLCHAATIGASTVSPSVILVNSPTVVTITAAISDPTLLPGSVNLLRVSSDGHTSVVATFYDDGQSGDRLANDRIFTAQVTFTEPAIGSVQLQVSAAFRGTLLRTRVPLQAVFVQQANAPDLALANLILALQSGNASTVLTYFAPTARNSGIVGNLDNGAMATLASYLSSATLLTQRPDVRIYRGMWTESDGSLTPVDFEMAPDPNGHWIISNW